MLEMTNDVRALYEGNCLESGWQNSWHRSSTAPSARAAPWSWIMTARCAFSNTRLAGG
jgi:hypothetical protein